MALTGVWGWISLGQRSGSALAASTASCPRSDVEGCMPRSPHRPILPHKGLGAVQLSCCRRGGGIAPAPGRALPRQLCSESHLTRGSSRAQLPSPAVLGRESSPWLSVWYSHTCNLFFPKITFLPFARLPRELELVLGKLRTSVLTPGKGELPPPLTGGLCLHSTGSSQWFPHPGSPLGAGVRCTGGCSTHTHGRGKELLWKQHLLNTSAQRPA